MYTILNQEDRNMSKKVYLTSDGYSYHTLELRYNPTDKAFRDCFERLQQYSKAQELYPQKDPDGRIYAAVRLSISVLRQGCRNTV